MKEVDSAGAGEGAEWNGVGQSWEEGEGENRTKGQRIKTKGDGLVVIKERD